MEPYFICLHFPNLFMEPWGPQKQEREGGGLQNPKICSQHRVFDVRLVGQDVCDCSDLHLVVLYFHCFLPFSPLLPSLCAEHATPHAVDASLCCSRLQEVHASQGLKVGLYTPAILGGNIYLSWFYDRGGQ